MTTATLASAHHQFEAALPAIRQSARYALRRRRRDRDDLLAEVIACAWKAWRGLVGSRPQSRPRRRDRDRRLGRPPRPQGAADRQSRRRPRRHGHLPPPRPGARLLPGRLLRFRHGRHRPDPGTAAWREWLVADRRVTPADEACFRLDFEAWLATPARAAPQDGRVAGPGAWDPRGRPARGGHAGGRQPGPLLARAELAGIPGRDGGGGRSRPPSLIPATARHASTSACEGDCGMARGPQKRADPSTRSPTRRRSAARGAARLPVSRRAGRTPCSGGGAPSARRGPALNPGSCGDLPALRSETVLRAYRRAARRADNSRIRHPHREHARRSRAVRRRHP